MNSVIKALSYDENIIQLRLHNIPKHPLSVSKIFKILNDDGINVDMISQVVSEDAVILDLTVDQSAQKEVNKAIEELTDEFEGIEIYQSRKFSKVALGGSLMEQTPGVAYKVFDMLGKNNIHFYQVTTSKRTISFVIKKEDLDKTLKLVHGTYDIQEEK
ncbi:MAG: ACT domain-containing protein [Thomasclavelia sp.]|jgi:aspartate kinase|nr:ACT domain-containing protein [Thomasclavelia sp.]